MEVVDIDINDGFVLDKIWWKALVICLLHIASTWIRPFLKKFDVYVSSFAGGMAVTYVFGYLLPEVSEGNELIGPRIYLFVLLGFVLYYSLERKFLNTTTTPKGTHAKRKFSLSLGSMWFYSFIIILGFPESGSLSHLHILVLSVAIFLHLTHSDFEFGLEEPGMFDRWGKYVLASAPLVGYAFRTIFSTGEEVSDVLTAILAGSIIYNVFRRELPHPEKTHFSWFLIGIVIYTFLLILIRLL